MAWKPKEKPLTPEEAIALARKELAPRWTGSPPLLAAIRNGERVNAYPLDPSFAKLSWLLLFVDPLEHSGEASLELIREWHQRYSFHELGFIALLQSLYAFTRDPAFLSTCAAGHPPSFSMALDPDELLASAFVVKARPKAILIGTGRKTLEMEGPRWFEQLETSIQKFLRERDPGLPLLPELEASEALAVQDKRIELGTRLGVRVTSDPQGRISLHKPVPARFKPGEFLLTGNWTQTEERIETSDPEAAIGFHTGASRVSLVAQALAPKAEATPVAVELGGIAAYDSFAAGTSPRPTTGVP